MYYLIQKIIHRLNLYTYTKFKNRVLNVTKDYENLISDGYYSQEGQDNYIFNLLNKKFGYFIDIGATDGIHINNSYYFEKNGWDGITIEPNPDYFKKLQKNRSCQCINACVGTKSTNELFLQVQGYAENYSGLLESYNLAHLKKIHYYNHKYDGSIKYVELPVINLMDILDRDKYDVLFIDTEGSEYNILSTINFKDININIICLENFYNDIRIYKLLKKNKYRLIARTIHDEIYSKL